MPPAAPTPPAPSTPPVPPPPPHPRLAVPRNGVAGREREGVGDQRDLARLRQRPALQRGAGAERDAGRGEDRAGELAARLDRRGAGHPPVEVAGRRAVDERDRAARGREQGGQRLEHEHRGGVAVGVEGEVPVELDDPARVVDAGLEGQPGQLDAAERVRGLRRRRVVRGDQVGLGLLGHGVAAVVHPGRERDRPEAADAGGREAPDVSADRRRTRVGDACAGEHDERRPGAERHGCAERGLGGARDGHQGRGEQRGDGDGERACGAAGGEVHELSSVRGDASTASGIGGGGARGLAPSPGRAAGNGESVESAELSQEQSHRVSDNASGRISG